MRLQPHRARYRLLDPSGGTAGDEDLTLARSADGFHLTSRLSTSYPAAVEVEVQWRLDASLVTRLLYIHSRDGWDEEYEVEATVTGNGMLAHRTAPSGPTQVELGWGRNAEFDYISAAFPTVILARSFLPGQRERQVDAVEFGVEDLVPVIVGQHYQRLDDDPTSGMRVRCTTTETQHTALIEVAASGALLGYEGLLELVDLGPGPTR